MAVTPTPDGGVRSSWKRFVLWLQRWEEALNFDISEYHERRIARLEVEVATLRSKSAVSSDEASSLQPADKVIS